MTKRIKLKDRSLPGYCKGEEIMNMVTHIVGGALGIVVLLLCLLKASGAAAVTTSAIYGGSMIALYAVSSIYHGLRTGMAKKVMQVLDHCMISPTRRRHEFVPKYKFPRNALDICVKKQYNKL